jgi:hypothetical protein
VLPDKIFGLPLHALVVHFVVVLLPVAAVGSLLVAVWPWARRRYGWLVVAAAALAAALVPVAVDSGNNLQRGLEGIQKGLGTNALITRHQELANMMIWWALGLFVAVAALMVAHTAASRQAKAALDEDGVGGGGGVATATATATATKRTTGVTMTMLVAVVATVGLAVGTGIHIYRVGDAGARTIWEDVGKNLK